MKPTKNQEYQLIKDIEPTNPNWGIGSLFLFTGVINKEGNYEFFLLGFTSFNIFVYFTPDELQYLIEA